MKNPIRSITQALFIIILAMTALAVCQPVLAGQLQTFDLTEGTTIAVGNQGLYVAQTPYFAKTVRIGKIKNLPPNILNGIDFTYRSPALEVYFYDKDAKSIQGSGAYRGVLYIFFNIDQKEKDLWFKSGPGTITIWHYNVQSKSWATCGIYYSNDPHLVGSSNNEVTRLTCTAKGDGYYVLAYTTTEAPFPNPVPTSMPTSALEVE